MTGLNCTILVVLAALYFIDGGRPYVMPFALAGVALGLGGHIVGRMAERAAEQADPGGRIRALAERTMERAREIEQRPKSLVNVSIRPVPGADCRYAITVYNGSPDTLIDVSLDHTWLLHPGKFGLDDTHMPADIWGQPPIRFAALGPGEQITSEVLGYNVVERYDGPKDTFVTISAARVTSAGDSLDTADLLVNVRMAW
ncbi:hypothetical protein LK542_17230 [Massilia sp. IC2-477]|uniref:hypothetical protein n=1 Tax=Massilia sp. IC2-477 TaxID=2887198 RepID=UPI001D103D95|nr:hypothetical protein [Massilia sp. IC2-477]MCC2957361.1 hypothetical protein [Massilia sp. IC2-477]